MKKIKCLMFMTLCLMLGLGLFLETKPKSIDTIKAEGLTYAFQNAVSFSVPGTNEVSGMALNDDSNFNLSDGIYHITLNGEITANFKPFLMNYASIEVDNIDNYYVYDRQIIIEKDEETGTYADNFEFDGETYYFTLTETGATYMSIFNTRPASTSAIPIVTTAKSSILSLETTDSEIIINVTMSYTLKTTATSENNAFQMKVSTYASYSTVAPTDYNFEFLRPNIKFADKAEEFVEFTDGGTYSEPWLKNDMTFSKLNLTFLNSKYNYNENSPLYFNINYNGFVYEFKLYTTNGNLYVEYTDESNESNNLPLATSTALNTISNDNNFTITFNYRGRYVIEFYDDTYLLDMNIANYYQTSFFIAEDTTDAQSIYNNMYIYAETIATDETPSEYIVHSAVENASVSATVKNLNFKSDNYSLKDVISYVSISKTLYGASDNINYMTFYLPRGADLEASTEAIKEAFPSQDITIYENLESYLDENGDFSFNVSEDAQYQINICPLSSVSSTQKYFTFTVIKNAITIYVYEGQTYTSDEDFKTTVISFEKKIDTSDPIKFKISFDNSQNSTDIELEKTYINTFSISLGNEKVSITGDTSSGGLVISCYGVGNLTVNVTFGGETITYDLNYEEGEYTLTFSDYGTYTVTLVDSIGTKTSATFSLTKKLNTSSILLIAFSALLLVIILVFVLLSRGTPKTR